jgi:hypothetical protein
LLFFFLISVLLRLPFLNRPLSVHHEWLTSTSLRHIQIFYEEGPWNVFFSPCLTYSKPADKNINYGLALRDKNGNLYYLSFPPFAFILPYFFFKAAGIYPNILGLQIFNLFFHLVSAFLIFLICRLILKDKDETALDFSSLAASITYLFSPAVLWFQANVYMSDTIVQPFFIASLFFFLKFLADRKYRWIFLLGAALFFTIYTEWLGIFFSFSLAVHTLLRWKQKRIKAMALTVILVTAAAIILTLWQYSQISGWQAYIDYAREKFLFRTGDISHASGGQHFLNPLAWANILLNYIEGYLPFLILLIYGFIKTKKMPFDWKDKNKWLIPAFLASVLPVLTHHFVFFNFTSIHDFAVLKSSVFISMLVGVLSARIYASDKKNIFYSYRLALGIAVILSIIQFYAINSYGAHSHYKDIGLAIKKNAQNDEVVFLKGEGLSIDPQYVVYAQRNLAYWENHEEAKILIQMNHVNKGVLFILNLAEGKIEKIQHFSLTNSPQDMGTFK